MTNETQAATAQPKARAAIIPVTPFEQNCTLIWCEATKRAVVIDPGGDVPNIEEAIAQSGVTVEKIWLTHGHLDHAGGAAELKEKLGGVCRSRGRTSPTSTCSTRWSRAASASASAASATSRPTAG